MLAWDTETELIRPGVCAPPLACVSICSDGACAILDPEQGLDCLECHLSNGTPNVGHNVAFDLGVICQARPRLIPLVFQALEADRITCTEIRAKLLDIAAGRFRKELRGRDDGTVYWAPNNYDLGSLARRYAGIELDKDTWRLRYGELIGIPIDQWPEGARTYPMQDALATELVWKAQEEHAPFLLDQYRQVRRDWWLRLMSNWGLRTDQEGVERFAAEIDATLAEMQRRLTEAGFVRADKKASRDTKAAARYMVQVCQAKGIPVVATKTMQGKIKGGLQWDPTTLEGVALDKDSCDRTEDPWLKVYGEFGVIKAVKSKDLKMLREGYPYPIHSNFDIVETGRTSSASPNVQNIRRLPGIRECFVPRLGHVFMQADFPGLELRTLAQVCMTYLGHSRLAGALNAGMDPHLALAAQILRTSYEDAKARLKAKDEKVKDARQAAKVANFGFSGGLGYKAFIDFARATYGVIVSEDESRHLKANWLETWPEMHEYSAMVGQQVEADPPLIRHLFVDRFRGGPSYTAACNSYFQGLGADATSRAGWYIARDMYAEPSSVLYGSRLVNFVHDEFIGECPDDPYASDRVKLMCALMVKGANEFLPDVPFKEVEPVLMDHWSKNAESLIDPATGRVMVYRRKAA